MHVEQLEIGDYVKSYWSAVEALITIPGSAADIAFPSVVISGLPDGITIKRVYAVLFARAIEEDSASDNAINGASKTIRVMNAAGSPSWGTDDIIALTFDDNQLYCVASTKENGFVMMGTHDLKAKVTGDGTYNFRAEETNRSDAIVVDANNLYLYDVQVGIVVEFER